jgi:DNA-binding MarR family transcriptional regulator
LPPIGIVSFFVSPGPLEIDAKMWLDEENDTGRGGSMTDVFRDSLGHNLYRIGQLVREETAKALQPFRLTPEQWQLLVVLAQHDGMTPSELGERTLRDKTTVSRILPGLVKKGWLMTEPNPKDARSYLVRVTQEQKPLVRKSMEAVRNHFAQHVFTAMTDGEQEVLLGLLLKLRTHLGD